MTNSKKEVRGDNGELLGFTALRQVTTYLNNAGFSNQHQRVFRDSKKGLLLKSTVNDRECYSLADIHNYAMSQLYELFYVGVEGRAKPQWMKHTPSFSETDTGKARKTALEIAEEKSLHELAIKKYTALAREREYEVLQKKYISREDHEKNMAAAMTVMVNEFNAMVKTMSAEYISIVRGDIKHKPELEDAMLMSMDKCMNRMLDQAFTVRL